MLLSPVCEPSVYLQTDQNMLGVTFDFLLIYLLSNFSGFSTCLVFTVCFGAKLVCGC